ncbi:hypothetical protein JOM56_004943 [Amanita muscaria]
MAIEQPNCHETCHSNLAFSQTVDSYPPYIDLPVEDWQEALKPLLDLQDKLLNISKPKSCYVTDVMYNLRLVLQLLLLQRNSHPAEVSVSTKTVTETSAVLVGARQNIPENDLDSCLCLLLSCLPKTTSVFIIDAAIMDHMTSLLAFDYTEVAARVRSVSNAQRLIDVIGLLTNNESFLSQCGAGVARKAACLALEIFKRAQLLPRLPLNGLTSIPEGRMAIDVSLCVHCASFDRVHAQDSCCSRVYSLAEFWIIITLFQYHGYTITCSKQGLTVAM